MIFHFYDLLKLKIIKVMIFWIVWVNKIIVNINIIKTCGRVFYFIVANKSNFQILGIRIWRAHYF